jgi:hypothetical protein
MTAARRFASWSRCATTSPASWNRPRRCAAVIAQRGELRRELVAFALLAERGELLELFDVFILTNPDRASLRRIVLEPARRLGHGIDDGLVEDLVAQVEGGSASLPLLSFTMSRLWALRDRDRKRLTRHAYDQLGGVAGALATYADQVFAELDRRAQRAARDLFERLFAPDGTRVPLQPAEFLALDAGTGVVDKLVDARLLVSGDSDDPGASTSRAGAIQTVEVIHESLARSWPLLVRWRTSSAKDRGLIADLSVAARRYFAQGQRKELLWSGEDARELGKLAERSTALSPEERGFARASVARMTRRRRGVRLAISAAVVVLAGLTVIMTSLTITAARHRDQARAATQIAERRFTQALIAQGTTELNQGRPLQALAYFAEALRRGEAGAGLRLQIGMAHQGWQHHRFTERAFRPRAILPSHDHRWLIGINEAGAVRWWDGHGKVLDEVETHVVNFTTVNVDDHDEVLVAGARELVVVSADRRAPLQHVPLRAEARLVQRARGLGGFLVMFDDAIELVSPAGQVLRSLAFPRWKKAYLAQAGSAAILRRSDDALVRVTIATGVTETLATGLSDYAADDTLTRVVVAKPSGVEVRDRAAGAPAGPTLWQRDVGYFDARIASDGSRVIVENKDELVLANLRDGSSHRYRIPYGDSTAKAFGDGAVWVAGTFGILRRLDREISSVTPVFAGEVSALALVGDGVAALGPGQVLSFFAATPKLVRELPSEHCGTFTEESAGDVGVIACGAGPETWLRLGSLDAKAVKGGDLAAVAIDRQRGLLAILHAANLELRDLRTDERWIVPKESMTAPICFDGAGQLWGNTHDGGYRLDPTTRQFFAAPVLDQLTVTAMVPAVTGVLLASEDGTLRLMRGDRVVASRSLGRPITALRSSQGHRWAVVSSDRPGLLVVDTETLQTRGEAPFAAVRNSVGVSADGAFLIVEVDNKLVIWDVDDARLLLNSDLFTDQVQDISWVTDRTLELVVAHGREELDLVVDQRPPAELLRDLDCHVPFKVVEARLVLAEPVCR